MATTRRSTTPARTQQEKDRDIWTLFFKLLLVFGSFAVDFGSNLFYTSYESGVTLASSIAAFMLMISDTFLVYFALVFWDYCKKGQYLAALRTSLMVLVSFIAVIVDFIATVEPVRMSLAPNSQVSWHIATLFGVFVALLTSYLQTDFLPTGLIMARIRTQKGE